MKKRYDSPSTPKEGPEHDGADGAGPELVEIWGAGRFDGDEEGQDAAGERKVKGDGPHGFLEGVLALQDTELEAGKYDGREGCADEGGNQPRGGNLGDAARLPLPGDAGLGSDARTDEGADDGVGGGDREAHSGGSHEPGGRGDLCAAHGDEEGGRVLSEAVQGDDAVLDGVGDARSEQDGAQELGKDGKNTGLSHGQGAGGHRGGERVGDVIGTVAKGTEDEGNGGHGEDPSVLGECWCHGRQLRPRAGSGWPRPGRYELWQRTGRYMRTREKAAELLSRRPKIEDVQRDQT